MPTQVIKDHHHQVVFETQYQGQCFPVCQRPAIWTSLDTRVLLGAHTNDVAWRQFAQPWPVSVRHLWRCSLEFLEADSICFMATRSSTIRPGLNPTPQAFANHDLLAGPWIAALRAFPFLYLEDVEITEFDVAFFYRDVDDGVQGLLDDLLRFKLREVEFVGDAADDIFLGHGGTKSGCGRGFTHVSGSSCS